MILKCDAVFVQWRPRISMKTVCSASTSAPAQQLRQQLDNLHKEADTTRDKANNARLRLMRLSEAIEKLRRQAAVTAQTGRENDARELLFQKKKVMQAMEKLKSRIELFDELSAKLNEAISMKESLLIQSMALDLEVSETEAHSAVRIVSPTEESPNNTDIEQNLDSNDLEIVEDQQLHIHKNPVDEESLSTRRLTGGENAHGLREVSTYEDFMNHIDQQLKKIEDELETFLRFSSLILDNKEKPEYAKVEHVTEILAGVCHIRERIAKRMSPCEAQVE